MAKRKTKTVRRSKVQATPKRPDRTESGTAQSTNQRSESITVEVDGLRLELDRPPSRGGRKNIISVRLAGEPRGGALVDRVDVFSFRSRHAFARLVADHFAREPGQVMGALAVLIDQAEREQTSESTSTVAVTGERKLAAEALLKSKNLLDKAATVLEELGHVGEDAVKRACFLVALSRFLARPLNALLLAPPGAGKSAVLDAVAALTPPEHVVSMARLTAQSLFYMGGDALRHRLVLVDEWDGQAEASHAIRVLQSRGELSLTTTTKGKAESFTVRGPVAVMSGSVRSDLDPQNTSRCLELVLDDSPAQTRRIHEAQARAWSGSAGSPVDIQAWHDAQRLLAEELPVRVVVPFAARLSFPSNTTTDRRAAAKVLGLIAAHAVLHERQRDRDGERRIVATVDDYRAVHAVVRPSIDDVVDGLSPRAARVYRALLEHPAATFTRRDIAARLTLAYNTAKRALAELLEQEAVAVVERGPPSRYRLLAGDLLAGGGLVDPDELGVPRVAMSVAKRRPRPRR